MDNQYKTINGYAVEDDGSLRRISLLEEDGYPCDPFGAPLEETGTAVELKGWGRDDGPAEIYLNGGGLEIIVPSKL